jgi:hypothetical protein
MDPAEIRFIRKAFIKERSAEVFRNKSQQGLDTGILKPLPIRGGVHSAVANIPEEFIAPLPVSRSVHSTVAYRE